jgi:GT2 family glycosyltransferase
MHAVNLGNLENRTPCKHASMRVSVVVPTYRRPASLARCLDALDRQTRAAEETIVVVRGDDTASRQVVNSRVRAVRLVLVHRPGVLAAMNAGLDASGGDVVALTDDDAAPHADWLERIVDAYAGDQDRRIAAVGGRDWVTSYKTGRLIDESEPVVGRIDLLGRVTGNHHAGVGEARDVDVLKGVNLSVRGELLRQIRFDERLRGVGTEHHWELALCLTLRRCGYRVVYDPAIAVDHHPQPRVDDSRMFNSSELRDARHNETLAVLEHLSDLRGGFHLIWACAIGTSSAPGMVQLTRSLRSRGNAGWQRFAGAQMGVIDGLRTYQRSRRVRRGSRRAPVDVVSGNVGYADAEPEVNSID